MQGKRKEEEEEEEDPKHLPELLNSMKSPGEHREREREEIVGQSERNKGEKGKKVGMGKGRKEGGGGGKIGKLYASHALTLLMQGIRWS